MPGDLTTTAKADRACDDTVVSTTSAASPSARASAASSSAQNRVSDSDGSRLRNAR
jgi:hypothetical protein